MKIRPLAAFLWLTLSLLAENAHSANQPKLYALLVFDTDANRIGGGEQLERDNVMKNLRDAFNKNNAGQRLELTILDGKNATRDNILNYFANLRAEEKDTLLFYCSSHGAMAPDLGQYFALTHGEPLYRADLRGAMVSLKPLNQILISDACDTKEGEEVKETETTPFVSKNDPDNGGTPNWDVVNDLFFGATGFIDVNSAKIGGFAYTRMHLGGFYTAAFVNRLAQKRAVLDRNSDGKVTWPEFLGKVDEYIARNFVSEENQLSTAYYLGEWPKLFYERKLRAVNNTTRTLTVRVQYYTRTTKGWDWISPNTSWQFEPGESATLTDAPPEGFEVRGSRIRIWAVSADGSVWNNYKERDFEMIRNARWPYAADRYQVRDFTFGE